MTKIIDVIKFIIIGLVQGITEILPISSSGHLALTYDILKIDATNQLDITIYLHLASSLALCLFFKDKIIELVKGFFLFVFKKDYKYKDSFKTAIFLVIASIPVAIVGVILKPIVENFFINKIYISFGFLLTSIVLIFLKKLKNKETNKYTLKNTFVTGLIQCFSIFPGISRSGITLLGSKIGKLNQEKGKEFTFLLLIPISLGSTILSFFENDFSKQLLDNTLYLYLISMVITFATTYIVLKYFFKYDQTKNYNKYSVYLFILSVICFINYAIIK